MSERNLTITRRALYGEKLPKLAIEYGITPTRVYQIVKKEIEKTGFNAKGQYSYMKEARNDCFVLASMIGKCNDLNPRRKKEPLDIYARMW